MGRELDTPKRKWLLSSRFFDTRAREIVRAQLVAYMADHRIGIPWLGDRILKSLAKGAVEESDDAFKKTLQRFIRKPHIRSSDYFVALIAGFASNLPYPPVLAELPPRIGVQMRVELAINDRAEAIIFHSQPFQYELSWLEFDIDTRRLSFIMRDGAFRDLGIEVRPSLARYMRRAKQILMVLMDEAKGEPIEGGYLDLKVFSKSPIDLSPINDSQFSIDDNFTTGVLTNFDYTKGFGTVSVPGLPESRVAISIATFEKAECSPIIGARYSFRIRRFDGDIHTVQDFRPADN